MMRAYWIIAVLLLGWGQAIWAAIEPPLPVPHPPRENRSPVLFFRELLSLTPPEREIRLRDRSATQRELLLVKLRQYESLPLEERDRRLGKAELRWYLRPLMQTSPKDRRTQLQQIPEDLRDLIRQRLEQWDRLAPELQKEVLENEWMLQYVVRFESDGEAQGDTAAPLSETARRTLEAKVAHWRSLPPETRTRMIEQFNRFFDLPQDERRKTLQALTGQEREQMQKTLAAFEKLPAMQRERCIDAFRKFANMSRGERDEFLRNAERWKAMTPREREIWRALVHQLPPLPPNVRFMPPRPPAVLPRPSMATNPPSAPPVN